MDKIFCPVNVSNMHWCMAVIYVQEKVREGGTISGTTYSGSTDGTAANSVIRPFPFIKKYIRLVFFAIELYGSICLKGLSVVVSVVGILLLVPS